MPPFLALLASYYICDAAAALHPMPPGSAQACAVRYEAVKATFLDEGEAGPAAHRDAYLRFKAWEAENAALVARLRAEARAQAADLLDTLLSDDAT